MKTTLVVGLLASMPFFTAQQKAPTTSGTIEKNAPARSVVVSLNRVSTESTEGRAANQRLQALAQKITAELTAKQKELSNGPELQKLAQQSQTEFTTTQRQVQAELRAKINPIVAELAAQRGAELVLNEDTLVWAAGRLDITDEVIAKLDAAAKPAAGK